MNHPVDVVVHHPRLADLPRSDRERARMNHFARDLARWLHGAPREGLGALARVVTIVARRELRDARRFTIDRPLPAVEAAARAVQALWPLLRGPEQPEPPPEPEAGSSDGSPGEEGGEGQDADASGSEQGEPDEGGGGGATSDGGAASEDGPGSAEDGSPADDGPIDPMDVLEALAEMQDVADPEMDALAERLREAMGGDEDETDVASAAGDLLAEAGQAATDAAIETDRVARHLERFLPGVGWSSAPGALEHTLLQRLDGLVKLLEQLEDLQKLADVLGRMEEPTQRKGHVEGGREQVVGVNYSGDVSNALPSELALLADEDTEDLFYQRYIEQRLISLELTGSGDQGQAAGDKRGPVIACIDTSGSMEGAPELAAKALVLAVCRRVLPRNRTVHLILFGGPDERTELRLRRGRGGLEALLDFLERSFHSSTDFDGPLLRAMDLLEERGLERADILVVTDGLCRATRSVIERVVSVRDATGARVWSVVLGRHDTRGVEPFSHEVLSMDPEAAASATGLLSGL